MQLKRDDNATEGSTPSGSWPVLLVAGLVLATAGLLGHRMSAHTGEFSLLHFLFGLITGLGTASLGVSLMAFFTHRWASPLPCQRRW